MPVLQVVVLHVNAVPGNQWDWHTLATVIEATEHCTGGTIKRGYLDRNYRGRDTANPRHVSISGQRRGVFGVVSSGVSPASKL
jgi:transposase, IS5 family